MIAGAQRDRLAALQQKVASPQEVSVVLLYCCVSSFALIRLVWQSDSRAQLRNMPDPIEIKLHDPQDQAFLASFLVSALLFAPEWLCEVVDSPGGICKASMGSRP